MVASVLAGNVGMSDPVPNGTMQSLFFVTDRELITLAEFHLPSIPFRNSLSDSSKAADSAAKCRSPTSRTPRSRSET
jgi:hypothetical protein